MPAIASLSVHTTKCTIDVSDKEVDQALLNLPAGEQVRNPKSAQVFISTRLDKANTPSQAVIAATVSEVREDGNVMVFYHRLGSSREPCKVTFDLLIVE